MVVVSLDDVAATEALGATLASLAAQGDVVFLTGELGAGKTSLARGYLRYYFQNPELDVPSPSYLLHFLYSCEPPEPSDTAIGKGAPMPFGAGRFSQLPGVPVHHLDPYRLPEGRIAGLMDFDEIWRHIAIVEWPDKLGDQLVTEAHPPRLEVHLSGIGPQADGRQASFKAVGERWQKVLQAWETDSFKAVTWKPSVNSNATTVAAHDLNPLTQTSVQPTLVLGIESSCDDTGAAVINAQGDILGECLASQHAIHGPHGGVVPALAQKAHREAIDATVDRALELAGVHPKQLSAVAVTVGPGLSMCLEVGVRKAYMLAAKYRLPIVRVHHMEAHAMMTRVPTLMPDPPGFPYLTLLVSGGHNMAVFTEDIGKHTILGSSLDDSIGEAFDKTARLLGITQVPGGPALEKLATTGNPKAIPLPKPLCKTRDPQLLYGCDFSFSGLKTAIRMAIEKEKNPTDEFRANAAASFQRTAVNHLVDRAERSLEWATEMAGDKGLSALIVAGGVAANKTVRTELKALAARHDLPLMVPPPKYCVDNGVMVAWTGMERLRRGLWESPPSEEKATFFAEVRPRWPIGPRDERSREKPRPKPKERKRPLTAETAEGAKTMPTNAIESEATLPPPAETAQGTTTKTTDAIESEATLPPPAETAEGTTTKTTDAIESEATLPPPTEMAEGTTTKTTDAIESEAKRPRRNSDKDVGC